MIEPADSRERVEIELTTDHGCDHQHAIAPIGKSAEATADHVLHAPRDGELEAGLAAVAAVPRLRVRGFMTMAPPVADPDEARPAFARLRTLRDALEQRSGRELPELSMGMSDDYWIAVEEGATMVRIGRAIFGARSYGARGDG